MKRMIKLAIQSNLQVHQSTPLGHGCSEILLQSYCSNFGGRLGMIACITSINASTRILESRMEKKSLNMESSAVGWSL